MVAMSLDDATENIEDIEMFILVAEDVACGRLPHQVLHSVMIGERVFVVKTKSGDPDIATARGTAVFEPRTLRGAICLKSLSDNYASENPNIIIHAPTGTVIF